MTSDDRSIYLVNLNGRTVFESPWLKEAANEYNKMVDNTKRGDYVTLWYIKNIDMPVWKDKNAKILGRYRK